MTKVFAKPSMCVQAAPQSVGVEELEGGYESDKECGNSGFEGDSGGSRSKQVEDELLTQSFLFLGKIPNF